jgi:hypothetical protein
MTRKKSAESNPSFDKISDVLGSSFVGEEIVEDVKEILEEKKDLVESGGLTLDDAEFMKDKIQNSIKNLEDVLEILKKDLKIGTAPRYYEVYATMENAKMNSIKELREMNKIILDLKFKLEKGKIAGPKNLTVNYNLTSKDVSKMIEDAKKNNSLKKIKADFKIEDEEKKNEK